MTVALALFGYALLLASVGATTLSSAAWVRRSPRLGIAVWQVLSASVILAVVLAGTALTMPTLSPGQGLTELLKACVAALRAQYGSPGSAAVSAAGAALALGTSARVLYCLARELVVACRQRGRQLDTLVLIGRRSPGLDAVIVDHATAAAYCLPGRARQIVLTSAALAALDAGELEAVLLHERAHLHGRHHLILAGAVGLQRAFPFVACFYQARTELRLLVEMLADDQASRRCPRLTVAAALVALADGYIPSAALPAGGPTALARVQRLVEPARPLGLLRTTIAALCLAAAFASPIALSVAPALAVAGVYCPV